MLLLREYCRLYGLYRLYRLLTLSCAPGQVIPITATSTPISGRIWVTVSPRAHNRLVPRLDADLPCP